MPTIRQPSCSLILRRARHYMCQVCPVQPLACHALLMTNILECILLHLNACTYNFCHFVQGGSAVCIVAIQDAMQSEQRRMQGVQTSNVALQVKQTLTPRIQACLEPSDLSV